MNPSPILTVYLGPTYSVDHFSVLVFVIGRILNNPCSVYSLYLIASEIL